MFVMAHKITGSEFIDKVYDYTQEGDLQFKGALPAIIDFYADWCGPCKMVAPILAELSQEYAGKIDIYKVNVDEEGELAGAFVINSIPALLFIPLEGQPVMHAGALPKPQLVKTIKDVLKVE
jgi:thioredoxin 1